MRYLMKMTKYKIFKATFDTPPRVERTILHRVLCKLCKCEIGHNATGDCTCRIYNKKKNLIMIFYLSLVLGIVTDKFQYLYFRMTVHLFFLWQWHTTFLSEIFVG